MFADQYCLVAAEVSRIESRDFDAIRLYDHPTSANLKRLEQAYFLKEELDSAWAARPIELTSHWDRTVLVLEDPGGVPLDQLLGRSFDLAFSLHVAISLCSAIGQLLIRRAALRNPDWEPSIRCHRSDGMGALSHR